MIRIVKKKQGKKIGFTLLEMVLVLAIMVMMSFYLYSTFRTVNYSHLKVTVVNDMHDYASLTLRAIQNHLCNATKIGKGENIKLDEKGEYVLINDQQALPGFTQYHAGNDKAKWGLTLKFYTTPAKKTVKVVLELKDNSYPESKVSYTDQITVYCPSCIAAGSMEQLNGESSCSFKL